MTPHILRLLPGDDLKKSLQDFIIEKNITAAWMVSCVGSLTRYAIRFADKKDITVAEGHFEILSVSGMLSINGSHLHISLADENGKCIGGHLADGSIIYTTAEIALVESGEFIFERRHDTKTGYKELFIRRKGD